MKVLAITLLCIVTAVHGRSAAVKNSEVILPELGDVRWLVHLRVAIGTSGLLRTGLGSMLSSNWVLTAASTVNDSRFIWIRYGLNEVPHPSLVIESNNVIPNPDYDPITGINNVAVVNVNRNVEFGPNHAPIISFSGIINNNVIFYGFGQDESGRPGERLQGFEVSLTENAGVYSGSSAAGVITENDIGAPLALADGSQIAILTAVNSKGEGIFTPVEAVSSWVEQATGLNLI